MSLGSIKGITKEILASTAVGLSGAKRTGLSAIESLPGVDNVQDAIREIAGRAVPLLAKPGRSGIVKASRDVEDPVAVEASEKGAAGGVAAQDDFAGHLSDLVDAHDAANISYAGSAGLQSADVEAALDELDTEKSPTSHRHPNATTSADGFQSKEDKAKLDGIAPGGGSPSATEAVEGLSRQATAQQIVDGVAGNLFATVARLKAELDRREARNFKCEVSRSAAQSIPNITFTTVAFNAEAADPQNVHAAGVFTVPSAGQYAVYLEGAFASNGTGSRAVQLLVGGAPVGTDRFVAVLTNDFARTYVLEFAAGQTFEVQVYQQSGGALNLTAGTRCRLVRLW